MRAVVEAKEIAAPLLGHLFQESVHLSGLPGQRVVQGLRLTWEYQWRKMILRGFDGQFGSFRSCQTRKMAFLCTSWLSTNGVDLSVFQ